jgi:GTP cyclohydrolase II
MKHSPVPLPQIYSYTKNMSTFGLDIKQQLARARADLRMGAPVIIVGTSASLIYSAEVIDQSRFEVLREYFNDMRLVITARRAETLKVACYDGDFAQISISNDRDLQWVKSVTDPSRDLSAGPLGPFQVLRNTAIGQERAALALLKSAALLPAAILTEIQNPAEFANNGLSLLHSADIDELVRLHPHFAYMIAARLPTQNTDQGRLHVFRPPTADQEHYAMEIGRPDRAKPVLVRLHSACFTGDVLGSLKCDCGPQLRSALSHMGTEGQGVLLYLNQEGRGIGLTNKMRAYALQDKGFDTVEANHRLGFEDDERDFRIGAALLREMKISQIRLMTNNPKKIEMMEKQGIKVVERVPLRVGEGPENRAYLATKAAKSGHLL